MIALKCRINKGIEYIVSIDEGAASMIVSVVRNKKEGEGVEVSLDGAAMEGDGKKKILKWFSGNLKIGDIISIEVTEEMGKEAISDPDSIEIRNEEGDNLREREYYEKLHKKYSKQIYE